MTVDLSCYLVTDSGQSAARGRAQVETVLAAIAGGVTTVQLREKTASARDFLELVSTVAAAAPSHVTVLVNDRVDVFLAARAQGAVVHGVHLGQSDLPPLLARQLIGPDALIGLSASTPDQVTAAQRSAARIDYVGIGAVHPTTSKADPPPALGIDRVVTLAQDCGLPAVGIGGLTPADAPALRAGGLAGAAVVSWICAAGDPRAAAAALRAAWDDGSPTDAEDGAA